jgi:nucleotide-binding universal stress UspA family protein
MIKSVNSEIKRIVVGVDGSDGSKAALDWAAKEASRRNIKLVVVSVWHPSDGSDSWSGHQVSLAGDLDAGVRETVQAVIDELRANWPASVTYPDVQLVTMAGTVAEELLEFTGPDGLLVVGSRGRKGLAGLILGSVATRVAHLARFPFAVIPQVS